MKVVKLNRTHNSKARDAGFTHAFRFPGWNSKATAVERALRDRYKTNGTWTWDKHWFGAYGSKDRRTGYRTYWIYVRSEKDITMTLLTLDYTNA